MVSAGLQIAGLEVAIGDVPIIAGFELDVPAGGTVVLLGPSGCGKSTLLRAIAGLEPPTEGTIHWDGELMNHLPAHRRRVGLMFQNHALFPHRSVGGNVAFGLQMQRLDRSATDHAVSQLLTLVGLPGFEDRAVSSLSGGEAQRVALARALAPQPQLLLLDEPLASLDRPLRERLLNDLVRLRDELGLTIVHVTHDRDEAFALADQVAVMRRGRVVAKGQPDLLWAHPPDAWVARFLGHQTIVPITVSAGVVRSPIGDLGSIEPGATNAEHVLIPTAAARVSDNAAHQGTVIATRFTAHGFQATVDIEGIELVATAPTRPTPGTVVGVDIDYERLVMLPPDQPR